MGKCMNISVIILASIGVGLLLVSVVTNYWRSYHYLHGKITTHHGLWKTCIGGWGSSSICGRMFQKTDITAKFAGIISLMLLAILLQAAGMVVGTVGAMMKKKLGRIVAVMHLLAVVAAAGGLGMFYHYYGSSSFYLRVNMEWSYYLGCVGTGVIFIEVVILIISLIMDCIQGHT